MSSAAPVFSTVFKDLVKDLKTTFPEYAPLIQKALRNPMVQCIFYEKIQVHKDDILAENEQLFLDPTKDTQFLGKVRFADLWVEEDISQKTRETLWKYLQVLLFSDPPTGGGGGGGDLGEEDTSDPVPTPAPAPALKEEDFMHLFQGKLGKIVREFAEELSIDLAKGQSQNMEQLLSSLKDPSKLMEMVNKISSKVDQSIQSGEMSKEEFAKESQDLLANIGKFIPELSGLITALGGSGLLSLFQGLSGGAGAGAGGGAGALAMNGLMRMMGTGGGQPEEEERILPKKERKPTLLQRKKAQAQAERERAAAAAAAAQKPLLTEQELIELFEDALPKKGGGGSKK